MQIDTQIGWIYSNNFAFIIYTKSKMTFQGKNSISIKKYSNEYFGERIGLFSAFVSNIITLNSIKKENENTVLVYVSAISKSVSCILVMQYAMLMNDFTT